MIDRQKKAYEALCWLTKKDSVSMCDLSIN